MIKNFETLKKEIENTRICKDLPRSLISKINIVKMAILPNKSNLQIQSDPYQNRNNSSQILKGRFNFQLHIKPGTLNLTEEKVGNRLELTGTAGDFLNRTP